MNSKLIETVDYFYDDQLLVEMSNIQPNQTGVRYILNVLAKGGSKHGARVKVSNIGGTFHHADNFSVSVEHEPRVVSGTVRIKKEHLDDIKDWIKLNHDHLIKVWNSGGAMSGTEIESNLQKL